MSFYVSPGGNVSFGNIGGALPAYGNLPSKSSQKATNKLNTYRAQMGVPLRQNPPVSQLYHSPPAPKVQGVGQAFLDVMKLKGIESGFGIRDTHPPVPKAKSGGSKKSAPSRAAVGRRVIGPTGPATPVAPPVDPLDTLRTEYGGYLSGIYGGLEKALGVDAEQYKTRSQEIADRIKAQYADANTVAGNMNAASTDAMTALAQRLGLQQAVQGGDTQDWLKTNERLKALNAAAQANSLSTNDLVRSNYYDFLVDRAASAKGSEATAQANLLDLVSNAKAQRLLMQQQAAAAAAAARARSRGRGGRGGGGSGSGSASESTVEKLAQENVAEYEWYKAHPEDALLAAGLTDFGKAYTASHLQSGPGAYANMNPNVASRTTRNPSLSAADARYLTDWYMTTQKGTKKSVTNTITGKQKY
jgi:hypothetical protein